MIRRSRSARTITSLWLCLLLATSVLAWPAPVHADGRWRRFSAAGDLLSNDVRALAYDHDASGLPRMWVGMDEGLQTYNGLDWTDHTAPASGGVRNDRVTALHVDEAYGVVWVGTEHGLNWQTRAGSWQTADVQGLTVLSLAPDGEGGVYVGTNDILWHCQFADEALDCQDELTGLGPIPALLNDSGVLWIGTSLGLLEYAGVEPVQYRTEDGLISDHVTALAVDGSGLWIGTAEGLTRLDPAGEWQSFPVTGVVHSVAVDNRERVWAATENEMLKWDARWESRDVPHARWEQIVDEPVSLVYAQPVGTVWTVTSGGLSVLDDSWEVYGSAQIAPGVSTPLSEMQALVRDEKTDEMWAASNVGVSHYDASTDAWDAIWTAQHGLEGQVLDLARDDESGELWAGTGNGVFHHLVGSDRWVRLGDLEDDLGDRPAWDILHVPITGTLWAGTDDGLMRYDADAQGWVQVWSAGPGQVSVYKLVLDGMTGHLWLGTSAGIYRYAPDRVSWARLWTFDQLAGQARVTAMLRNDETNELWVGAGTTILHYRDWQWTTENAPEEVRALARDPRTHVLWVGTNNGVYAYDPEVKSWEQIASDVPRVAGKPALALALDKGAGLWIGMDNVVARFATSAPQVLPWARVSQALCAGIPCLQGDLIKLLDGHDVDIRFEGGSFVAQPADLRYRYELRQRDQAPRWITPTLELVATYTLPYGEYDLELRAQDGTGRWPEIRGYKLAVQARPVVTLTHIQKEAVRVGDPLTYSVRPGDVFSATVVWSDPDDPATQPSIQYGWFVQEAGVALNELCGNGIAVNCWTTLTLSSLGNNVGAGSVPVLEGSGLYNLLVRAVDAQGNPSLHNAQAGFRVVPRGTRSPFLSWAGVLAGVLIVVAAVLALRAYPDYASSWGAASGYPVRQLIPLVAPLNDVLDLPRVQAALRGRQAYTTEDQIQIALEALARARILRPAEGGGYRFAHPFVAWIHRLRYLRRRDRLAEAVRSQHPLYAGARDFFGQAGFNIRELSPQALLLEPKTGSHPLASYGTIYTRMIAGRSPDGDDFEDVYEEALLLYEQDVRYRLAFVVLNRRPTPGARLRLYEIRQSTGLAIVTLDRELFGQVKPNMPASDILSAQVDQSTGRQNLYAISSPVSDDLGFFGRETVLQQLSDFCDAGQPVGVFGLRKTGKTSLLQRLRGQLATRRVIASLDMQGTAREDGILPLYATIVGAFVAHIRQYRPGLARSIPSLHLWPPPRRRTLSPEIVRVFADDLRNLHSLIGGDERLLLLLDEVDRLLPMGSDPGYEGFSTFLGQLRAANQGLQVLDLIVAGVDPSINRRDKWGERDNELYQALQEVWLPAMGDQDTREMIESIGFQMGFQYEPAALERIIRAGGGQPFLTRQICSQVVKDLVGRGAVTITDEQARLGIEAYVYLPDTYITELWSARLDGAQRLLLLHLAQFDGPVPRADLLPPERRQAALANLGALEECTIILCQDEAYSIGWGILRDWIRWIELGLD